MQSGTLPKWQPSLSGGPKCVSKKKEGGNKMKGHNLKVEFLLLALLALLWGSSYLFIKVAVTEIPPITLIAMRVTGAAVFLLAIMGWRKEKLPTDGRTGKPLAAIGPRIVGTNRN
jgi:hypothetical protein